MIAESSCPEASAILRETVISSDSGNGQEQSFATDKQTTIETGTKSLYSSRYEKNANAGKSKTCSKNNNTESSDINKIATDHQDYEARETLIEDFLQETRLGACAFCDKINGAQVESYITGKVEAGEQRGVDGDSQFIDSFSILRNKDKLKRFWEHKMEMDFKLQQQQQQQMNGDRRKNAKQKTTNAQQEGHLQASNNKQLQLNKLLVTFDENNNNGNANDHKDDTVSQQQGRQVEDNIVRGGADSNKANGQVATQFSDEEWRSLSPNEEQVSADSTFKAQTNGDEQVVGSRDPNGQVKHQVSSELVYKKLDDYQAKNSCSNGNNLTTENGLKAKTIGKDPVRQKASIREQQPVVGEVGREDSGQLMSIDPTLCHSGNHHQVDHRFDEGDEEESNNFECEEQTANEEFSSSSSSFGPVSISLARQDEGSETTSSIKQKASGLSPADDEEPNSNLSGSVATVIRMPGEDDDKQETAGNEMVSNVALAVENTDEEDCSSSNIGVAFESLQFDDEIKSSKQELVDPDHLIASQPAAAAAAPMPLRRPSTVNKFNAKEVKTVCNLITAAISDASRQVENFMSRAGGQLDDTAQLAEPADLFDQSGSIQRATYVQESSSSVLSPMISDQEPVSDDQTTESSVKSSSLNNGDSSNVPKADLSSIFEASVRREIERFEANSMLRRSTGNNKLQAANNGLTEWRIAEEIRLFNEREMELKRRLKDSGGARPAANQQVAPQLENCEPIVRFGKTFYIPKSTTLANGGNYDTTSTAHHSKSIKLSTTAINSQTNNNNNSSPTTTISMHKFISSGGKRFVYTNTTTNGQSCQSQNLLTKSMSNISLCGTRQCEQSMRPVDYKAVDSLSQKETPNVKPGLTRKVIETFSRMNNSSNETLSSLATTKPSVRQECQKLANLQNAATSVSAAPPTAEWKIQEELREMRAREAELRDQRRFAKPKHAASANGDTDNVYQKLDELDNGNSDDTEDVKSSDHAYMTVDNQKSMDRLSFSSESLYPIKQAIDSFRKLNSSQPVNNSFNLRSQAIPSKIQRIYPQDLSSSVNVEHDSGSLAPNSNSNGQRRKISMIERWESRGP